MKTKNILYSLLFVALFGLTGLQKAEAATTLTCPTTCDFTYIDKVGVYILDLQCNATSPVSYNGRLTVNGVTTGWIAKSCPTGTWSYPRNCPTACGTAASTITQTCTGGNGVCSGSALSWACSATAACAGTPDLTATFDGPSTATAGTAVTLSSTVSNTGTGSTGASFSTLFEIDNTNNPAFFTDINAVVPATSPTLNAGGSNTAQVSYTFPSAGTWYVRACADTNVSNVGSIVESNEGNNCSSPWTAVVVSPAPLISCDAAHVSSAWSTCSSSATCTYTPPQPSQLTGQIGTHYGFCPSPPYTSFPASEACYDAVVDCTLVSPPTTCPNDICEIGETTISCPTDCPVIVTEF